VKRTHSIIPGKENNVPRLAETMYFSYWMALLSNKLRRGWCGVFARFSHQGPICLSVNRLIVDRKVYPQFVEAERKNTKVEGQKSFREQDTFLGMLINRSQVAKVLNTYRTEVIRPHYNCLIHYSTA
jgi:hypothetical protein